MKIKNILHISLNLKQMNIEIEDFIRNSNKSECLEFCENKRVVLINNERHEWKTQAHIFENGLVGFEFHEIVGSYPVIWNDWLKTRLRSYNS